MEIKIENDKIYGILNLNSISNEDCKYYALQFLMGYIKENIKRGITCSKEITKSTLYPFIRRYQSGKIENDVISIILPQSVISSEKENKLIIVIGFDIAYRKGLTTIDFVKVTFQGIIKKKSKIFTFANFINESNFLIYGEKYSGGFFIIEPEYLIRDISETEKDIDPIMIMSSEKTDSFYYIFKCTSLGIPERNLLKNRGLDELVKERLYELKNINVNSTDYDTLKIYPNEPQKFNEAKVAMHFLVFAYAKDSAKLNKYIELELKFMHWIFMGFETRTRRAICLHNEFDVIGDTGLIVALENTIRENMNIAASKMFEITSNNNAINDLINYVNTMLK